MQVLAALFAGLAAGTAVTYLIAGRGLLRRKTGGSARADAAGTAVAGAGAGAGTGTEAGVGASATVHPAGPEAAHSASLARRLLEVMRPGAIVLDPADEVVLANPAARMMGVLRSGQLASGDLLRAAGEARTAGTSGFLVLDLPRARPGRGPTAVSVHVVPLDPSGHVAVVLEDVTEARRLEAVRRDFVANISHELKTPVGALTLLAEAIQDAADDPEAVRRFAGRMQHEGTRLGRLMQELIELSRLQGADPLPAQRMVSVDRVVDEALDRTRLAAESAGISVVSGGERGLSVCGDEARLVTALVNLLDNAIAYSPSGTRVALGTRCRPGEAGSSDHVEITVTDQGIGISESDLERIFERFYRADPARSRATGGTGLGLAIVKHVASNHGGSVGVWSAPGSGSTFTLRLPVGTQPTSPSRPGRDGGTERPS